jgi:hypothetical protein
VGAAALPGGAGQGGADGLDQATMRVAGDQPRPAQAAGGQVAEESQPADAVLGAGDLQAEDLPVPVGVDAGGEQRVYVDHPAALADLEHQRVGGQERVRPLVQRPGAERLDLLVELGGHHRDLRLRQPGDAQRLDKLLHPPGRDAEQVAGRHHRGQRALGAAPALQQPVREVATLAQLRDRHVQHADGAVIAMISSIMSGNSVRRITRWPRYTSTPRPTGLPYTTLLDATHVASGRPAPTRAHPITSTRSLDAWARSLHTAYTLCILYTDADPSMTKRRKIIDRQPSRQSTARRVLQSLAGGPAKKLSQARLLKERRLLPNRAQRNGLIRSEGRPSPN